MGSLLLSEPTLASRFERKKKKKRKGEKEGEVEKEGEGGEKGGKKKSTLLFVLVRELATQYLYPRRGYSCGVFLTPEE